jgi:hypothetical protein
LSIYSFFPIRIIIVVDLDVIMDKCDLIGDPVPVPKEAQSAAGQLGSTAENSQYLNNGSHAGGVNGKSFGTNVVEGYNICDTNMLIRTICGFGFGILLLMAFWCFC